MEFGLELATIQKEGGRHYLLENPKPSGAWREPSMMRFFDEQEATTADFDQCRYGNGLRSGGFIESQQGWHLRAVL